MSEAAPNPELEARRLADLEGAIDETLKGVQLRQATIVSYDSGTALATIRLGGDTTDVAGVKHLSSYSPAATDTGVWAAKNGADLLLIGATGGSGGGAADTADVATSQTETSSSYGDLATSGPAVTLTLGNGQKALVTVSAVMKNSVGGAGNHSYMSFAVSGASTLSAADGNACVTSFTTSGAGTTLHRQTLFTASAAGSTTFTAKYRVQASTGTYQDRRITVIAL